MTTRAVNAEHPADTPLLQRIRESVIGEDQVMHGPYGPRRVTYADYTAGIAALLHRPGALSLWDCAAAGPYVDLRMGDVPG